MPTSCSVPNCKSFAGPQIKKQFFGFPLKDPELTKIWVQAINRDNFVPSQYSKVCGDHFLENDYLVRPGSNIRRLKPDAVPHIVFKTDTIKKTTKLNQDSVDTNDDSCIIPKDIPDHDMSESLIEESLIYVSAQNKSVQTNICAIPQTVSQLERRVDKLKQIINAQHVKITKLEALAKLLMEKQNNSQEYESDSNKELRTPQIEIGADVSQANSPQPDDISGDWLSDTEILDSNVSPILINEKTQTQVTTKDNNNIEIRENRCFPDKHKYPIREKLPENDLKILRTLKLKKDRLVILRKRAEELQEMKEVDEKRITFLRAIIDLLTFKYGT